MKTILHKDSDKELYISGGSRHFSITMDNIYGEAVTRKYQVDDYEDVLDMIEADLNWWGFNNNLYEILDKIDAFVLEL